MSPVVRVQVILQGGLAAIGQPREQFVDNVAVLDVLVALECAELLWEVLHQQQVGLVVMEIGQGQLGR